MTGERTATVEVGRGLYTLRFRTPLSDGGLVLSPPVAEVRCHPSSEKDIDLIFAPGNELRLLERAGSGMVVLAKADGVLVITVRASVANGSLAADFDLERVESALEAVPLKSPTQRLPLPEGISEFLVCAHVSMRGDMAAHRGDWICGPASPGRIEGIEVRSSGGELPLEYQVATAGRGGGWARWTSVGAYAGTRGRATPLIGVRFRLSSSAAPDLILKVDGVFLGSPVVSRSGREVELIGPSSLDPLVGIRVDVAVEAVEQETASNQGKTAGRLRVFRGAGSRS